MYIETGIKKRPSSKRAMNADLSEVGGEKKRHRNGEGTGRKGTKCYLG